jgi:anti-sigma regulatory factor (Ser/Thr protein kinase)
MTGSGQGWREIPLPDNLEAPALARRWLLDGISAAPTDLVDTAALLVSELVTNAIRYGQPAVTARMRNAGGTIEVIVTDCGDLMPTAPDGIRPDSHQLGGRGLFILAALASEWGMEPLSPGPGKAVWFRLRMAA